MSLSFVGPATLHAAAPSLDPSSPSRESNAIVRGRSVVLLFELGFELPVPDRNDGTYLRESRARSVLLLPQYGQSDSERVCLQVAELRAAPWLAVRLTSVMARGERADQE